MTDQMSDQLPDQIPDRWSNRRNDATARPTTEPAAAPTGDGARNQTADATQRTILVIDDSLPTRTFYERLLSSEGYAVILAQDGEMGARLAMEQLPDLILLDKELPGISGFAVSRLLRRYAPTSYIPILMISAVSDSRERIRGLEMGADDFLAKDIPPAELYSKIRAFLRIKDLQDEIKQERDKLSQIFRFLHEPVVICNEGGNIVLASQVFLQLFQLPWEIARQRPFAAILETLAVPAATIRTLGAGTGEECQFSICLDDPPIILSGRSAPIRFDSEGPGLAYIFRDITQKIADQKIKADFHSMIAHDLRSPLSVIQGYVSLMATGKTGPVTDIQSEFLTSIDNNTTEITALLNDFLDISKIDAGFVNLKRSRVPLHDIVEDSVVDLGLLADNRGIEISTEMHAEPVVVDGDPLRIKQILRNLLDNAIKYNRDQGWIKITTTVDDRHARVDVSDSGVGMSQDEIDQLFKPYQRVGVERKIKGVGLGLVIVKKLVEAHGGRIEVSSQVDQGTTFSFTVPLAVAEPTADSAGDRPVESAR